MTLRLATWNCRMGVDRKRALIDALGADVIVVPECAQSSLFAQELGVSSAWRGIYPTKGLGVFALGGWRVEPVPEPSTLPWVLPVMIIDPAGREVALLLAVWTVPTAEVPAYPRQVALAIAAWESEIRDGRVIIAGDFNCSAQGTDAAPHRANMGVLEGLGAVSAYHAHYGVAHGEEPDMTLRWVGRGQRVNGYHCDLVVASRALSPTIRDVQVGTWADWIDTGHSDHCPVIVEFAG